MKASKVSYHVVLCNTNMLLLSVATKTVEFVERPASWVHSGTSIKFHSSNNVLPNLQDDHYINCREHKSGIHENKKY